VRFRAVVIGIGPREAEAVFRAQGLTVQIREFSPVTTVAVGLAKKRVLEMEEPPVRPVRLLMPFVLGLWAVEAILFFLAVASFLLGWTRSLFWLLVAASLSWGGLSFAMSLWYLRRVAREGDTSGSLSGLGDIVFGGAEAALVLVAILLAAALVWFVLFIVWLPLVLVVLAALTFGEAWRIYRCLWVVANDTDGLRRAGKGLLDLGAVVSRSWDTYLEEGDRGRAMSSRKAQYRANRTLAVVGVSSLGLMVALLSGKFLPEIGATTVFATTALLGLTSILFVDAVRRLRGLRSRS